MSASTSSRRRMARRLLRAALVRGAHRRQYENFLAALDGTEQVRVDLETNRQAIAIITRVYESARTGRPVILT